MMMIGSSILLQAEVEALQTANQAANRRHQHRRKCPQHGGILTVQEGLDLVENVDKTRSNDGLVETAIKQRRCGNCGKTGHNARACKNN
ncbi:hypothetical protein V1522DRAFT_414743 [Lipomyces starkeyi]